MCDLEVYYRHHTMWVALYKPLKPLLLLTLCMTVLAMSGICSRQTPAQSSTQSTFDPSVYLPPGPGQRDAAVLALILHSLDEPSLLEASKEASVRSFRVSYFSNVPLNEIAVHLVVNSDGGGQITSAISRDGKRVKRTANSLSATDVEKFLQLVDKVGFWLMASIEKTEPKTDQAGHTTYVLDGSWWMVEGVRDGSFHYVYRRNPRPSPFTEIAHYVEKDLAKLDDSVIPIPNGP